MTDDPPRFWQNVRPWFHDYFQFWPDHEDLIWAKSIWPILEGAGYFADTDDEADSWNQRHILALAILYAESAQQFGVPDYRQFVWQERNWLTVTFGSVNNLDTMLDEVGRAVCFHFDRNQTFEGDPAFFIPLIRSLVTGSGSYSEGPALDDYLTRVEDQMFDLCEFREDRLLQMWIGGHFLSRKFLCLA